jgi:hypothetical protein
LHDGFVIALQTDAQAFQLLKSIQSRDIIIAIRDFEAVFDPGFKLPAAGSATPHASRLVPRPSDVDRWRQPHIMSD